MVTSRGYRHEAVIVARSTTGRDHAISVPFGTEATIQVIAPHLIVNDDSGQPVSSVGTSVAIPAAGSPPTVHFTVVGVRP
jgi:hypothetical protein